MCGFAGLLNASGRLRAIELEAIADGMASCLKHRGPDSEGLWSDPVAGVALGFRRLRILDLSATGDQPMHSANGRYVLVFNGEIYNHRDIRRRLSPGRALRGTSDTEVFLEAIAELGLPSALRLTDGMFALALWDRKERVLQLARDRVGEKPLYYGFAGGDFIFGSELKALREHPDMQSRVDRHALSLFMRFGHVPTPHSIFEDTFKLRPGTILRVSCPDGKPKLSVPEAYWSLDAVVSEKVPTRTRWPLRDAADRLEFLLRESVKRRMVADVPLGAFLSGGIDSSSVAALMQAESGQRVRTFTIGFHEGAFDEASFARAVAQHLGTEHTELYVTPTDAEEVVPQLPSIYDEPFADSSQIPTMLLTRLARGSVTVALSGDGGDELFGGYERYFLYASMAHARGALPRIAYRTLGTGVLAIPTDTWDKLFPLIAHLPFLSEPVRRSMRREHAGSRLHRLMKATDNARAAYERFVSHWDDPFEIVIGAEQQPGDLVADVPVPLPLNSVEEGMYVDHLRYLPEDILVKVDRASMAVALECRLPLLSHELIEFAWSLPPQCKVADGKGKLVLREMLSRYLPRPLFERPKMGFGVPVGEWIRGPLRDWAEEMLSPHRLDAQGYLRSGPIQRRWEEHKSGEVDWTYLLWDILMFEAWQDSLESAKCVAEGTSTRGGSGLESVSPT